MENYFEIGKIVNTQGVRGEVRILPSTDDIKRFEKLKDITIYKNDKTQTLEIENIRYHKNFVICKFKNIDTMDDGEKLRNYVIRITDEQAIPLEEDEYFIRDLIGIEVFENNIKLGEIYDVILTGANDVYAVKTDDKDILIPAIKQCILNIDMKNKKMEVKLLKGLVD